MIRVKPNLIKGPGAGISLTQIVVVYKYQVSGLSDLDPSYRIRGALTAVDGLDSSTKVPSLGDPINDPYWDGNLICVNIDTESPDNPDVIDVTATFRWRNYLGQFLKTVSGSLRQRPRIYNGGYTLTASAFKYAGLTRTLPGPNGTNTGTITNGVLKAGTLTMMYIPGGLNNSGTLTKSSVPLLLNQDIMDGLLTFKFLEQLDPEYFNNTYKACVNSVPWRGYPARTMMILPITGSTQDNIWYDNQYTLQYNGATWDEFLFYVDPFSGVIPPDVDVVYDGSATFGNGWLRIRVRQEIDFNLLFADKIPLTLPNNYGQNIAFVAGG